MVRELRTALQEKERQLVVAMCVKDIAIERVEARKVFAEMHPYLAYLDNEELK